MMKISWHDKTMSGELFERIAAVLLGREHPTARRIRPASGDGGVDIYIDIGDEEIDVYQCKHFGAQIRWDQVKTSLKSLKSGKTFKRRVRNWYLVVPKTLSKTQKKTFDKHTKKSPFKCYWFAEDQLDSLAASYPEVGEYYFGDGKKRLDVLKHDYQAAFERLADGVAVDVDEVAKKLEHLSDALGRNDPHLEYGLSIQPTPMLPPSSTPRLIMWEVKNAGGKYFQISTYARYDKADRDAAERLQVNLSMTEPAAERVNHLMSFGGDPVIIRPDELIAFTPPTAAQLSIEPTMIRMGAKVDTTRAEIRVHLSNGDCSDEFVFSRFHSSSGHSGATTIWKSPGEMLHMRFTVDTRNDSANVQLTRDRDFATATFDSILKDLQLFKFLRSGNTLTVCQVRGPVTGPSLVLDPGDMVSQQNIALYQALSNVQDITTTRVEIPDELDPAEFFEVLSLGALLQGELVANKITSDAFTITFPKEADPEPGSNYSITEVRAVQITLPHQDIELIDPVTVLRTFRSLKVISAVDTDEVEADHVDSDVEVDTDQVDSDEVAADKLAVLVEASPFPVMIEQVADIYVDEDNPVPMKTLLPVYDVEAATTFEDLVSMLADPCTGR